MIKRLALFSTLGLVASSYAFTDPKALGSSIIEIEEAVLRTSPGILTRKAKSAIGSELFKTIFSDKKKRIHKDFAIPKYFKDSTEFWFAVYAEYSSRQVLIHDKNDLSIIYSVLDFQPLHNSKRNIFAIAKLQADLALEESKKIKRSLSQLHLEKNKLTKYDLEILESIERSGVKIPKSLSKKKSFFKTLSNNLRTQTGQRDMVFAGIERSLPYLPFIESQFKNFDMPKELLAIAFVESSFNLKAQSYAGAAGIWQFMPRTASAFMPKRSQSIDYRSSPIISSIAAMHLLKQNKQILKRWDLAVPAYNFGTSHLVRAKRKYKEKTTLAYVLENYEHDNVGFASKNYFAEVLAMSRVLAYKDDIFSIPKNKGNQFKELGIYVTKCRLRPKTYFSLLKNSSPKIETLNSHFLRTKPSYSKHKLVISDLNLTSRKYRRVSNRELRRYYPKNLFKLAAKSKCGK